MTHRTAEAEGGAAHRTPLGEVLLVASVYLVGTGAFTWPWLAKFPTHVVGPPGDNFEFLWKLWWVPHRIRTGQAVMFAENVFSQSGGYHLGSTDMSPVATFAFAPLTAAVGPVPVYNLVMLLSYVLAGLGTYLLARRLGASRLPALVAGAAFAYSAFHLLQASAHLNVAQIGFTPWAFLAADVAATNRRARDGLLLGLVVGLAGLTTWYRLVFLAFTLPVFLLVRNHQLGGRLRRLVPALAVAGVTTGALTVPFLLPAVSYNTAGGRTPAFTEAAQYALSIEDYLMPPPGHPVLHHWIDAALAQGNFERIVYPGMVVLTLALLGLAAPSVRRRGLAMAAVAAVAAVLSFGPVLRWFGLPVVVDVGLRRPWTLHQVALEGDPRAPRTTMAVPMPVYPIARYAPFLRGLRAWERAAEMTILGLDVMAALTLTALLRRLRRPAAAAAGLAVLSLVVFDAQMHRWELVEPGPRAVDHWLAAQPDRTRVVQLPYHRGKWAPQLWWSIFNGTDVMLAQASVLPTTVEEARPILQQTFPYGKEWLDVLRRWGVRYVLVDQALDPPIPRLDEAMQGNGLRRATRQGTVVVYEIPRP